MKRYLRIYWALIRINYHRMLIFRSDTIKGFFATMIWGVFSFIAIFALSSNNRSIYGWSRDELFILTGAFNIIVGGLFRTIADWNFEKMPHIIQRGELDSYLVKPIDSQFLISCLYIRLHGIIRVLIAVLVTIFILNKLNVPITFLSSSFFIGLLVFGLIVMYAMWFIMMTFLIWLPDLYNLPYVAYAADNLTRYPQEVLWAIAIPIFYVFFPFTLVVATPTKALLHNLTIQEAMLLISIACVLLFVSRKFWKFALRYYASASG